MKHLALLICMALAGWVLSSPSYSQCIINTTYTAAGIYPDTLPDGTAGVPYDVDVTFVMLTDTLGLTIYSYRISSIVGLPIGINWQCNNFQNNCIYNPAVSLYGCVKLNGTPVVPGNFTMTVSVIADVQLVGQQTINFDVPLTIMPGSVNNPGFGMTNPVGCAPLVVDFINNNPGQAAYLWDFGNGLQSTLENPSSQIYTTPGTYVVTQTVTPNITPSWYLTNITVTSIPNNYGGFIDDPDMYFLLYDPQGGLVYDSHPSVSNTFPPVSWNLPNIPLQNGTYTVHVWDEDGGLFGADDDLGSITFAGNGTSGSATGTVSGATGTLNVNYTIFQTPVVPLTATDTIQVFALPSIPVISASGPVTLCENDSVVLSVQDTVNLLQWYNNGAIMVGETGMSIQPAGSGSYSVVAGSAQGCNSVSAGVNVTIYPLPAKPTFFINGNIFTTGVTGVGLQWYQNGLPVPGATNNTFTAMQTGTYQLCATDLNGCMNCSDTLWFVALGMESFDAFQFQIYPNPTKGSFQIILDKPAGASQQVTITDLAGKVIDAFEMKNISTYQYSGDLNPGVYFIEIKYKGLKQFRKLVVQ